MANPLPCSSALGERSNKPQRNCVTFCSKLGKITRNTAVYPMISSGKTSPRRRPIEKKEMQELVKFIQDFNREIESQHRHKKLMAYLDRCAQETEWVPLAVVERRLRLPAKLNKRKRHP